MPRAAWPAYQTLAPLVHAHRGRPAVIIGGGPSRDAAMKEVPAGAVLFSANDHGVRYFARQQQLQRCNYIVACDRIEARARRDVGEGGTGEPWGLPVISRLCFGDYRLLHMAAHSSGMMAAWAARIMGCAPIIVVGMDCYRGGTYADAPDAKSTGRNLSPEDHRKAWRRLCLSYPAMYRAVRCYEPLRRDMGDYDPGEPAEPIPPRQRLLDDLGRHRVRLRSEVTIMQRPFPPGLVVDLGKRDLTELRGKHFDMLAIPAGE